MNIVLVIGAGEYPLEEAEAIWLESTIRRTCFDASGRPWDREAAAALHVADVLDGALSRRSSPEPLEVGRAAALGLLNVFQDNKDADDVFAHVARSEGVAALYLALRRFVRDAAWTRKHGCVREGLLRRAFGIRATCNPARMPVHDREFQSLLEQVRELHQLADDLAPSKARIEANVRARLSWDPDPPSLPPEQRQLADEVVEVLAKPRLSSWQARQLRQIFFGR